jgi:hypothetical protein
MEEKSQPTFSTLYPKLRINHAVRRSRAGRAMATSVNEVLNLPNLSAAASFTVLAPFVCKDRFILHF